MMIAGRLRALRQGKNLSQGDLEERTGLKRFYISRVENGHSVPSVVTLEKFARALEVPLYYLFYEGEETPSHSHPPKMKSVNDELWGAAGKDAQLLSVFCRHLSLMNERDTRLLLVLARRMATRNRTRSSGTVHRI